MNSEIPTGMIGLTNMDMQQLALVGRYGMQKNDGGCNEQCLRFTQNYWGCLTKVHTLMVINHCQLGHP